MDLPWKAERMADVPEPSELFDPRLVSLQLIEANVARAQAEQRSPLGTGSLRCVLTGNAFPAVARISEPYLRRWKEARLRSFHQWGLLAGLRARDRRIDEALDELIARGLVERFDERLEDGQSYEILRATEAGRALLDEGRPIEGETA